MKKLKIISGIIILTTMTSCNKFPELGDGYQLGYNSRHDLSIGKPLRKGDAETVFIYGHILSYAFDSTFILAAERPRNSVIECAGVIRGMTKKNCDEAFEKSTFRQYWIINKKKECKYDKAIHKYSNVYGPFSNEKYLQMREELDVPKELQLKEK